MGRKDGRSETKIELDDDEVELLIRVLKKHRTTIPGYLQSMQDEVDLIESILEKLS